MRNPIRKREESARRRAESAEAARRVLEKEIAERKRVEGELRYHLAVEEALVRAAQLFTSTDEPDLTQLLGLLGEAVSADYAYIFLSKEQGNALGLTHEWCAKDTESQPSRVPRLNPADFPWFHAQLDNGKPVTVANVDLLPAEVKNEKFLKRSQPPCSILIVPVRLRNRQMIGFLGFEALTTKRTWSDEEVRLLSVVSEMFACSFARKAVEDALRAAERDYRALFENAVEGIYRSSLDGRQLRANPALVKLNGYSSEEEMLPSVNDIATEWYVDPHRREEFKFMLEKQGTVTEFESEIYRHKTRERIWISETARLVRDAQGAPLYYEGTVQDITARKRAENALREREARLTAVFRAVNDVIVTFDLDETITGVNRAIERIFGYKPEEVLGQPSVVLVTSESVALARARTVRAWRGESLPALFEVEGVHKDGRRIPLEASASFLYEGDKPVGLVSVLRDISPKKELERQRADFLAMLTHDIKNPMQVILGCAELLSEELLTQEQHTLLRRLRGNALTVHSLMTNYLDLSKIESGHLTLRIQPLLINTLLRQVSQQYEAEAERRGLALHLQLQDDLPLVEGDPLALERVFANLLHNAIKFTPRFGRITIHSALRDNSVVVRIVDSGPGIVPEELASLFVKYRQVKEVRTAEGAGLGLFIVRALVEAHGGQVEAESIPGQGACFSVLLPMPSFSSRTTV
jgi:PAS domain S-box-containing protein